MGVRHRRNRSLRKALVAVVAVAVSVVGLASAEAHPARKGPHKDLTVMTYNLYLGSSLNAALVAQTPAQFVAAVAQIYGTAMASDFPTRAEAVADIVAAEQPDLIGLQEVTDWVAQGTHAGATPVSQDFLQILTDELAARGLTYDVAAVSQNADIGPAPLISPQMGCAALGDCFVSLKDRDVILVNNDTRGLHWWGARSGRYATQQSFAPPGTTEPVSFSRGWASIEARYRGERFRFADTHLEVSDFADVQEAQAEEFLAGPGDTRHALIAVGDFNSAADLSTTDSYTILTSALRDAWEVNPGDPGYSSGQNATLSNPTSQLDQRIDLILTRSSRRTHIRPLEAHLVGDEPFRTSPPPLWASDHAGVVASLLLR